MKELRHPVRRGISASVIIAAAAILLAGGCRGGDAVMPSDALVRAGKSVLTRGELLKELPGGLSPEDSTKFARSYISTWVNAHLLSEPSHDDIDMAEIDRLTDAYRRELIMNAYRRKMAEGAPDNGNIFRRDSLEAYFEANKGDFRLRRPVVKGIYIKVAEDADNLKTIRRLYKSDKPEDIDRLEKAVYRNAVHYDYFRDRWIDWDQVEVRIPYDFGTNPATVVASGRPLEVSKDGFVYLLKISEYLPAGSQMPFEVAEPVIRERLLARYRRRFDSELRADILEKAIEDGTVEYFVEH